MKIVAKFTTCDGKVTTATFIAQPARLSAKTSQGTCKREGNILKISGDQSFTLTMERSFLLAERLITRRRSPQRR